MRIMKYSYGTTSRPHFVLTFSSENTAEPGFLSEIELSIFSRLIKNRLSLPVCRDGYWSCYECHFESDDLSTMAMHILRTHKSAPLSDDEILDDISLEVG